MNVATRKGKNLGILGIVSRAACGKCDLKVPVFFAELDWDALTNAAQKLGITYYDLPKTQAVKRDLALLIDTSVTMADIEKVVKDSLGNETKEYGYKFNVKPNTEIAKNLKGHLMLVTGDMDKNVNPAHTYRMAQALIEAGKDFYMLVIPGAGHGYGSADKYFEKKM